MTPHEVAAILADGWNFRNGGTIYSRDADGVVRLHSGAEHPDEDGSFKICVGDEAFWITTGKFGDV